MLDTYTLVLNALEERDNVNEIDCYNQQSITFEPFELFLESGESLWIESEDHLDKILDELFEHSF